MDARRIDRRPSNAYIGETVTGHDFRIIKITTVNDYGIAEIAIKKREI